jgi:uncharacterized protein (DUF1697 family)
MNTLIALLRGINVGGRNKLRMADLTDLLQELGLSRIKTYIQSGNVVFQCQEDRDLAKLSAQISQAIAERHGFTPFVLLLTAQDVNDAVAQNPFPDAGEAEPKTLHLFFLATPPTAPDLAAIESIKSPTEEVKLMDSVFYLHAPDGIGRSKLAAKVEKLLGVDATARNWNTVSKLIAMTADM